MALAFVAIASWNVDAQVDVEEVHLVVELPAPLGARPIPVTPAAIGEAEFDISVFISNPEVPFDSCPRFLTLVKGFEDVDGLGKVAVTEETKDVVGVGFRILNTCAWIRKKRKGLVSNFLTALKGWLP